MSLCDGKEVEEAESESCQMRHGNSGKVLRITFFVRQTILISFSLSLLVPLLLLFLEIKWRILLRF